MSALDKLMRKPTAKLTHIEYAIKQSYAYGSKTIAEPAADDLANIDAELSALRERVEAKDKALRLAEWGRMTPSGDWACPVCKMLENHGHLDNCELAAALQAP